MTKIKAKSKHSTEKIVGIVFKAIGAVIFLTSWLYVVYNVIFTV